MQQTPTMTVTDDAAAPGLPRHPRQKANPPLLKVQDLQLGFQVGKRRLQAVRGVSLTINEGAVFAIVGESGCGKSSLAKTICGMYRPDSGSVLFRDIDVHNPGARAREVRRGVQLLFQEPLPSLNPRHSIRRIFWEPMQANGLARRMDDVEQDMVSQLAAVGLPAEALDRFPRDFSGGQLQRIALARILLLRPALICADEPVSALDVSVQAQVVHLLERLRVEQSLTYLIISHDLPLVSRIADRVAVMYLGEVVESGPADEVAVSPLHPYTTALRSATPTARSAEIGRKRTILRGEPPSPFDPPKGCAFHTRCPVAQAVCSSSKPALVPVGDGRRRVACHFAGAQA
jgi:oligopeptide/dipeptide ABC transporter ATP-binding protein